MICYIQTSGSSACDTLSRALWALARPPQTRSDLDTSEMFPSITCVNGSVWLQVDTTFEIPVHPDAELNGIADVLQPWVKADDIPASVIDDLRATVISLRGRRLVVWNAFPLFFQQQAKSHDDLVEMNLLRALT